jgi:cytochrome c5
MKAQRKHSAILWLGAASVGLMVACGSNGVSGSASTGVALTESPVLGTVTLNDSSAQPQTRTVDMQADGQFSLDVDGLVAPFVLRADWTDDTGARQIYAVAEGRENLDINSISDVAFTGACDGEDEHQVFDHSDSKRKHSASTSASAMIVKLHTALAPLFERYGIANPKADKAAVRALLKDVQVTKDHGTVTVTNRATHGVIFVGPLSDLASGIFSAENMPAGPGGLPGTCTSFTYSPFGLCQPDGSRARTVLTSLPDACTGGVPVTTEACNYLPPANSCTSFTYPDFGACQPGNSQSRTVLTSLPVNCTGGSPITSQACTYVPPVNACTSFTYSAYGSCQSDSTQSRTVQASLPAGCTGGSPIISQACTYVPPVNTCTSFTYSAYGSCQSDSTQSRTVLTSLPASCTGGSPITSQACTYIPPVSTCTSFTYSAYGSCQSDSTQSRTVLTSLPASCTGGSPITSQACTYVPPGIDGSALYTQYCSGCHGNSYKGAAASDTKSAIDNNVGGMGSAALRALTPAQLDAIAAAP